VSVIRAGYTQDPNTGEQLKIYAIVWQGEVLIRRVTATVQRLEMGQILTDTFSILIAGEHDIREGDFVEILEHPYWATNHPLPVTSTYFQIQRIANFFGAYNEAELNRYQQNEGP
jgi:exo-beta-1,3-glucanase (GH17 family)